MKMFNFSKFRHDESGAITVDWVVLCGAVIGISFGIVAIVVSGLSSAESEITDTLDAIEIG
jgi:Flp pilus assembly protein TadG